MTAVFYVSQIQQILWADIDIATLIKMQWLILVGKQRFSLCLNLFF